MMFDSEAEIDYQQRFKNLNKKLSIIHWKLIRIYSTQIQLN
jgi:hypothetical protein